MKFKILVLTLLFCGVSFAQKDTKKDKVEKNEKTIEELTKSSKKIEGLFTIYQDTVTAEVKMVLKEEQFQKEFIYFSQIADGILEAGSFRGSYRGSILFEIKKSGQSPLFLKYRLVLTTRRSSRCS